MKKFGTVFGIFFCSFLIGYGVMLHTSQWGPVARDPAAIRQVYDFSNLSGSDLTEAMKKRILSDAIIVRQQSSLGIELGHFAMAKLSGEKTLACQEFDKVVLKFEADGIAVSGERPVMEVEGACEYSSDMTRINPVFIPIDKILAEKPGDGEYQYRDGRAVTLRFHGMPDEWPTRWILTSVRLLGPQQQKDLFVDANEVSQILGRPMMVNFK